MIVSLIRTVYFLRLKAENTAGHNRSQYQIYSLNSFIKRKVLANIIFCYEYFTKKYKRILAINLICNYN